MKIPKYIETALNRRSKAALSFVRNDFILSIFIQKNGLENKVDIIDHNYYGIEAFIYREEICERIRQAIIDKEK